MAREKGPYHEKPSRSEEELEIERRVREYGPVARDPKKWYEIRQEAIKERVRPYIEEVRVVIAENRGSPILAGIVAETLEPLLGERGIRPVGESRGGTPQSGFEVEAKPGNRGVIIRVYIPGDTVEMDPETNF
jgi:hypothetical protein